MHNLPEAHISVITKTGKDPNLVSNYCPISLLNVDLKIFAKYWFYPGQGSKE